MLSQPINNRHIIDDALNALATALSPFVANKTGVAAPTDLSALLREMLGRWDDAFHAALGYRGKNLVYEIRDIRNDWAHYNKPFDDDDTDRALDSIERLLTSIDATAEAALVNRLKDERRRARYGSPVQPPPATEYPKAIPPDRLPPTDEMLRRGVITTPSNPIGSKWPRSISIRKNLIGRGAIRRFEFNGIKYEVPHDELVRIAGETTPWLQSFSWIDRGGYSTSNPSGSFLEKLRPFANESGVTTPAAPVVLPSPRPAETPPGATETVNAKRGLPRRWRTGNIQQAADALERVGYTCAAPPHTLQDVDIMAQSNDGSPNIKVRCPGRLSIQKKYLGECLHICFQDQNGVWYLALHDELVRIAGDTTPWLDSPSWQDNGGYSSANPSSKMRYSLRPFALNFGS